MNWDWIITEYLFFGLMKLKPLYIQKKRKNTATQAEIVHYIKQ